MCGGEAKDKAQKEGVYPQVTTPSDYWLPPSNQHLTLPLLF